MDFVIGTGPAGAACASALINQGREVTVIDVGANHSAAKLESLAKLKTLAPTKWSEDPSVREARKIVLSDLGGTPLKSLFGSDFPYREPFPDLKVELDGSAVLPSYAHGGFSSVWGAAVMPYPENEIDREWPVSPLVMAEHYKNVSKLFDLAANPSDPLAGRFPLYHASPTDLMKSPVIRDFYAALEPKRIDLGRYGIHFGGSRLALKAKACEHCGLCMVGCPTDLIYRSSTTIEDLARNSGLKLIQRQFVDRFEEKGDRVFIYARDVETGLSQKHEADRVFLACGPIATPRLVLNSLGIFDQPLHLLDSQYFLAPLLRRTATPEYRSEAHHSLAQAFIEIFDPHLSTGWIHLQLYAFSETLETSLKQKLSVLGPFATPLLKSLLGRMMIIQGYLHSDLSSQINFSLRRDGSIQLSALPNSKTRPTITRLFRKLNSAFRGTGTRVISPALQLTPAGRGFHVGGAFPMSKSPESFESDLWGRTQGLKRVHVVDASTFPTLPSTTITYTVMANAHRIADEVARGVTQ